MVSPHAAARLRERVSDPTAAKRCLEAAESYAQCMRGHVAALVWRIGRQVGRPWSDTSNGDLVLAIIRDGVVKTFMFRRSTQPLTAEALGVQRVVQ